MARIDSALARKSDAPEETETHIALWRAIREGRLASVTDDIEYILGRKPMTLRHWAAENANSFLNEGDRQ
jgi:hypothetical protein